MPSHDHAGCGFMQCSKKSKRLNIASTKKTTANRLDKKDISLIIMALLTISSVTYAITTYSSHTSFWVHVVPTPPPNPGANETSISMSVDNLTMIYGTWGSFSIDVTNTANVTVTIFNVSCIVIPPAGGSPNDIQIYLVLSTNTSVLPLSYVSWGGNSIYVSPTAVVGDYRIDLYYSWYG